MEGTATGTAASCTWFLKAKGKKKGSAFPQLVPSSHPGNLELFWQGLTGSLQPEAALRMPLTWES